MKRRMVAWWSVEAYFEVEDGQDPEDAGRQELRRIGYSLDEIIEGEPTECRELDDEEWAGSVGALDHMMHASDEELEGHLDGLDAMSHGEGRAEE